MSAHLSPSTGSPHAAILGLGTRGLHFLRHRRFNQIPVEVSRELLQLEQRVARPFGLHFCFRLVGLGVLEAMAFEPGHFQADQRRSLAGPHMGHRFADQPRGLFRFGPIAIPDPEVLEAGKIGRDVPARRLVIRCHRDAVAIVLDVK